MIASLVQASLALQPAAGVPLPAPIIVTGSRLDEDDVTARIDAEEIDRLQPATLTELLDRLPGVRSASTAGAGGTSFVSVRGGDPNFTLVLIDGVRVNDPTNSQGGGFDFAQLEPTSVESVSLVSTSASAVHGSEALGGVLTLRLRAPAGQGWSGGARLQADTAGGIGGGVTLGTGWSGGGLLVSGSAYDSGELTPGSDLRRGQALAHATETFGPLSASAFSLHAATRRSAFPEAGGGPLFAASPDREQRNTALTVLGLTLAGRGWGRIEPSVTLGWTAQLTDVDTPAIAPEILDGVPAITSRTLFHRFEATAAIRFAVSDRLTVLAGGDHQREEGSSRGTIDFGFRVPADFDLERTGTALLAEAEWRPARGVSLSAALRHDWFRSASETTPRLVAALDFGNDLPTLRLSYSEGFKLPSLYALGNPLVGNPALRPERSRGVEVALRQAFAAGWLRLAYHHTDYRDLIDFDVEQFTVVNRLEVAVDGVEAEALVRVGGRVELAGDIAYAATDSAVPLRSRPEWQGSARLLWRPRDTLTAELGARFNGEFLETSVPTGTITLPSYTVISAAVRWEPIRNLAVSAALENAADASYQDAIGFPAPSRLLRLSTAFRF